MSLSRSACAFNDRTGVFPSVSRRGAGVGWQYRIRTRTGIEAASSPLRYRL
jgi:hypothetical protein